MNSPIYTPAQIVCHNIVTSINGEDAHGNVSFDANLLHASPVAEQAAFEIVNNYRHLLGMSALLQPLNYMTDMRQLWSPLVLVLREFAYRNSQPPATALTRFSSALVPNDPFEVSKFLGAHYNRITRVSKLLPASIDTATLERALPAFGISIFTDELLSAHAAIIRVTSDLLSIPIINSDEFRAIRQRYADSYSL